ncbi:centrosomal protein of 55 kDa-like [Pomacea canaliculata]|uniref:centrosomal protein of 55 kDa-like n=1 Tax=Pomacea canaliculata TaxID=400727 RepID=UPI000D73F9A3|nr:centrosomal protein of 55 kDa-like [Pomacea canaliculata]XP_025096482.1 centrosomal protein of 55 kDa-like [Pomacea canaliculata]
MTRLDPTSSQQQQKDEADELRRKLEEARQEIENLKHLLDYKSQDLEKAFEEVTKLEEHITKLKEEQKELEDKLRMEKKLRKDLEKQIKNHEKKMKEQDDKIKIQDITIKDKAKKNKIDKNKLLEQMHNMEIKLTEEMKRQQQEHRKEITVLAKSFQKLATQFEDQNKIVHEVQKKQSENEQASKSTNQVKNVCKVQLVDPAKSSGQRQRQTTHKPVTAAMTFSMKDNTSKRK